MRWGNAEHPEYFLQNKHGPENKGRYSWQNVSYLSYYLKMGYEEIYSISFIIDTPIGNNCNAIKQNTKLKLRITMKYPTS